MKVVWRAIAYGNQEELGRSIQFSFMWARSRAARLSGRMLRVLNFTDTPSRSRYKARMLDDHIEVFFSEMM